MGKLRFYTCGKYGLMDTTSYSLTNTNVYKTFPLEWKDINGNSRSAFRTARANSVFAGTLYATTETEQSFNESNYNYTAVSGVTLTINSSGDTVNASDGKVYRTVSVTMNNTGSSSAIVPSVTNVNYFGYNSNSGSSYNKEALSWCYIFDTPITLAAGETKTVVFNFGYTLPTNDD